MKKEIFEDRSNLIMIYWAIGTDPEDIIIANGEEKGHTINKDFWRKVNDSIEAFSVKYKSILKGFIKDDYVSAREYFGDEILGIAYATKEEMFEIINTSEDMGYNNFRYTSSSGTFNPKELDLLHDSVDAYIEFTLPEKIVKEYELLN